MSLKLSFISQILICYKKVQFCLLIENVPQKSILAFHCEHPGKGEYTVQLWVQKSPVQLGMQQLYVAELSKMNR